MAAKMAKLCSKKHIFQPSVNSFSCKHLIFLYVSLLRSPKTLTEIWLICIFIIATRITELCSTQQFVMPATNKFYCGHLIFVYISAEVCGEFEKKAHLHIQYGHRNGRIVFRTTHFSACTHNIRVAFNFSQSHSTDILL